MELSKKHQKFVDEFTVDQNATQAYKRAGYKPANDRTAKSAASRLYKKPEVRAAIDARLDILAAETRMTAREAWGEVDCIVRSNVCSFLDLSGPKPKLLAANEVPEAFWKSCKSIKVKRFVDENGREVEILEFTLWPKLEALALVLKALGELDMARPKKLTIKDGGELEGHDNFSVAEKAAATAALAAKVWELKVAAEGGQAPAEAGATTAAGPGISPAPESTVAAEGGQAPAEAGAAKTADPGNSLSPESTVLAEAGQVPAETGAAKTAEPGISLSPDSKVAADRGQTPDEAGATRAAQPGVSMTPESARAWLTAEEERKAAASAES